MVCPIRHVTIWNKQTEGLVYAKQLRRHEGEEGKQQRKRGERRIEEKIVKKRRGKKIRKEVRDGRAENRVRK